MGCIFTCFADDKQSRRSLIKDGEEEDKQSVIEFVKLHLILEVAKSPASRIYKMAKDPASRNFYLRG